MDKDDSEGVFIMKFGLVICFFFLLDCILDGYILINVKIFIFNCRDFVFLGEL